MEKEKMSITKVVVLVILLILILLFSFYAIYKIYNMKDYTKIYEASAVGEGIIITGKKEELEKIRSITVQGKEMHYDFSDDGIVLKKEDLDNISNTPEIQNVVIEIVRDDEKSSNIIIWVMDYIDEKLSSDTKKITIPVTK